MTMSGKFEWSLATIKDEVGASEVLKTFQGFKAARVKSSVKYDIFTKAFMKVGSFSSSLKVKKHLLIPFSCRFSIHYNKGTLHF